MHHSTTSSHQRGARPRPLSLQSLPKISKFWPKSFLLQKNHDTDDRLGNTTVIDMGGGCIERLMQE